MAPMHSFPETSSLSRPNGSVLRIRISVGTALRWLRALVLAVCAAISIAALVAWPLSCIRSLMIERIGDDHKSLAIDLNGGCVLIFLPPAESKTPPGWRFDVVFSISEFGPLTTWGSRWIGVRVILWEGPNVVPGEKCIAI
ncbi:MAG: hypothetical protein ACHRHE_17810, partial [Tepidisphaerales bacterium]